MEASGPLAGHGGHRQPAEIQVRARALEDQFSLRDDRNRYEIDFMLRIILLSRLQRVFLSLCLLYLSLSLAHLRV